MSLAWEGSPYVISSVIAGIRLDHRSCEVLEKVLSRLQMTTLDLEKTNLEDEVRMTIVFSFANHVTCLSPFLISSFSFHLGRYCTL